MKTAFIGLGIMGSRMAANILRGGHEVTVYNRSPEKARALERSGARVAPSAADAVRGSEVAMTMLAEPSAVEQLALGEHGFLRAMGRGSIWVDFSTVNPHFSRRAAQEAAENGVRFIDAPVAGTKLPAEKGELTVLAGGEKADLEKVSQLLDLVAKKVVHAGPIGSGTSLKMVINLMLASAMASFAEALTLGQSLGLEFDTIANALIGGPVAAPFLAAKRDKIQKNDYETEFPLRLMQKDLHLVATEAYEHGVALPGANAVKELYAIAVRHGLGDLDFSAVYRELNPESN